MPNQEPTRRGLEHATSISQSNFWNDYRFTVKTLISGGVAGCCAKTTTAPLDRLKILYQAKNKHYSSMPMHTGFAAIWKNEGFFGYFKGNGAMMARVFPYAAIQFTAYEQYKKVMQSLPQIGPLNKLASGSLAGMTAVMVTYPLDLIRARLAFQVHGKRYNGIVHALGVIFREERGVRGLYRGFVPTLLGMIPYAGVAFYTYEVTKFVCLNHLSTFLATVRGDVLVLTVPASLLCGASSGLLAQVVAYPLDVVRRRMQLSTQSSSATGWVRTFSSIYAQDGIYRGLYRGLSLNFVRVGPQVAVSFTVYEKMKQFYGIHKVT